MILILCRFQQGGGSYTKRYHGDLYVLVLDKYAETFPAQTRESNKGCRAKQIAPRRVRTCGLYKSVSEFWYALWHSGKRLPLWECKGEGSRYALRPDTTESRPQVQYFHGDAVYSGSLEPSPGSSLTQD